MDLKRMVCSVLILGFLLCLCSCESKPDVQSPVPTEEIQEETTQAAQTTEPTEENDVLPEGLSPYWKLNDNEDFVLGKATACFYQSEIDETRPGASGLMVPYADSHTYSPQMCYCLIHVRKMRQVAVNTEHNGMFFTDSDEIYYEPFPIEIKFSVMLARIEKVFYASDGYDMQEGDVISIYTDYVPEDYGKTESIQSYHQDGWYYAALTNLKYRGPNPLPEEEVMHELADYLISISTRNNYEFKPDESKVILPESLWKEQNYDDLKNGYHLIAVPRDEFERFYMRKINKYCIEP